MIRPRPPLKSCATNPLDCRAKGPEGIGGALITGRKGGLMPAALQMQALPEFLPVRLLMLRSSALLPRRSPVILPFVVDMCCALDFFLTSIPDILTPPTTTPPPPQSAEGLQGPRSGAGISSGGARTSTTSARSGPPARG